MHLKITLVGMTDWQQTGRCNWQYGGICNCLQHIFIFADSYSVTQFAYS